MYSEIKKVAAFGMLAVSCFMHSGRRGEHKLMS